MPIDDEVDDVADVYIQFDEAKREREARDLEWWVCWEWYRGNTQVFFDGSAAKGAGEVYQVSSTRPRSQRSRPINIIGHAIDLAVAKQMKARPTFDASPSSSDPSDRLAARAVRDLLRHLWLVNKLTSARRTLFLNRCLSGNAFVKVLFDQTRGPFTDDIRPCDACAGAGSIPMDPSAELEFAAIEREAFAAGINPPPRPGPLPCPSCNGVGQINAGRKAMGDVAIVPVSPWEIYPVIGGREVTDGVFHAYRVTPTRAAGLFGGAPEDFGIDDDDPESRFAKLADIRVNRERAKDGRVWVIEKWEPPASGTESPILTIVCGRKLVQPRAPVPERYGRVPFFHFRMRPVAENFWGEGIVLNMISANDFVNRARHNFHKHMQQMAYVKWMVQKGSVDKDSIVAEEGEVVEYWGSDHPRQVSPATMPDFYQRLASAEEENVYKLAGLQEIDRGVAPPNLEAFQALHFLAEQSETVHGPVLLDDQTQWEDAARAAVACAVANYQDAEDRIITIAGSATRVEVAALLRSNVTDSVDVVCEIGSALAHSKALRTEQVFRGLEVGVLQPQEGRHLLEFGVMLGEDESDRREQESVAILENDSIARGMEHICFAASHDHEVHAREHRRAALEAQMRGDMRLAQRLDAAASEHLQAMAPPAGGGQPGAAPPAPAAPAAPFDTGSPVPDDGQAGSV